MVKVDELLAKLRGLVGIQSVKAAVAELRDVVEFDLWRKAFYGAKASILGQSFHMSFLGNPGTGTLRYYTIIVLYI